MTFTLPIKIPDPITRRVFGTNAVEAAALRLAGAGVWFEIIPEPCDMYAIKVKREAANLLPVLKDWKTATDDEVLNLARCNLGEDPSDNSMQFVDDEATVVIRQEDGAWVTGQIWVDFPTDRA